MMIAWAQARAQALRTSTRENRDRGADIVQYAIITAVLSAAALVILGILVAKAKSAANGVKTQ